MATKYCMIKFLRKKKQKQLFISKLLDYSHFTGANGIMAQVTFVGIACYWLWDI
jgi:hypothetical protein